jgi:hypothetical protein
MDIFRGWVEYNFERGCESIKEFGMRLVRLIVSIAVGFAFSLTPVVAQWLNYPTAGVPRTADGKPDLSARAPRTADGKPDLSGLWEMDRKGLRAPNGLGCEPVNPEFVNIGSRLQGGLPYQPWAAQVIKTVDAEGRLHDPLTNDLPIGLVRLHTLPTPRKIIQVPGLLAIMNEYNASYRQIFTDGRPLLKDPSPAWYGYSTGAWDGETLVVQTNGFRDGLWLDSIGSPLTEAAKITERFHRVDFGQLEVEITVDDPRAYTRPWTVKLNQTIRLDTDLLEYFVNENEKDIQHIVPK